MAKQFYCGLDIGTSSTKAVLFEENLQVAYQVSCGYKLKTEYKYQAELNPSEVWQAVLICLQGVLKEACKQEGTIIFISFSSALHSLIVIDEAFAPLTGCLTWADTRALEIAVELEQDQVLQSQYERTGCPPNVMYLPAKLRWLQNYQPEIVAKAFGFLSIKEYILYRLTGQWVVDYSLASGSGLLNLHQREWDRELLQDLGLTVGKLGRLVDGTEILSLTAESVALLGADIPLVVGSGDGPLANLGAGAYSPNDCVATIGTSGAIRVFSPEPVFDRAARLWCYMLDRDTYVFGGAINNGGLVVTWFTQNWLNSGVDLSTFNDFAREVQPGSRGLLFLPFLTGERSPHWNPYARGMLVGLDLSHGPKEMARAVLEGMCFRMYSVFKVLSEATGPFPKVLVNGGFTQSDVWLQIMADLFNCPLVVAENYEGSALGAVLMGLKATGRIGNYRDVDLKVPIKVVIEPQKVNVDYYRSRFAVYEAVYQANAPLFRDILEG